MRYEHRGWIIDLWLVGIHFPNYPYTAGEEAKAVWEYALNGDKSCATKTGDREEVLDKLKAHIDWRIDDPNMENIF